MKTIFLTIITHLFLQTAFAQDSSALPKKISLTGYINDLQSLSFNKDFSKMIAGNLIHNRINIKWKPGKTISFTGEFRNQFYWGDEVRLTPGFVTLLKNPNEAVSLQKVWLQDSSMVFLTNIERLYLDYSTEKWNIRVGRQRVNWGMNATWNPNDIFNSYNFLLFDYVERPGVDGAKARYILSGSSNVEIAYSNSGGPHESVTALKYFFNKWNYDFQVISGLYHNQTTIGAGWAGSIKSAGFKGEAQYYFANRDSVDHLNISVEGDYMFGKGWYLNLGLLFNNKGINQPISDWDKFIPGLSPMNLMPTKWNIILTNAKEVTPLLSTNISIVYTPMSNLLLLYPSFRYNLATNLDFDLVWQSFFTEQNKTLEAVNHRCFLRFKWSF
jgi:hypothetical protein